MQVRQLPVKHYPCQSRREVPQSQPSPAMVYTLLLLLCHTRCLWQNEFLDCTFTPFQVQLVGMERSAPEGLPSRETLRSADVRSERTRVK